METSRAQRISLGHIVACAIILITFVIAMVMYTNVDGLANECSMNGREHSEVVPLLSIEFNNSFLTLVQQNEVEAGPKQEVIIKKTELDNYITTYLDDIKFLCYTLSIDYKDFIKHLYKLYNDNYETYGFDETNVGYIKDGKGRLKSYINAKYGLVEYIYAYVDKNPKKQNIRRVGYTGSSNYVENLIRYYTSIYTNVDTNIALSIGAAESGYYKAKGMIRAGNVYGGMSSGGLIHYDNIEIGVLSYIRLLSNSYFGKGLNTFSKIGYRYCPTIDNNGNKIVSPNWMNLVNTAKKKYDKQDRKISASDLLGKIEIL
ncbi:MAG: hypothetical protein K6C11_01265 [Bacilli bacterium]|nr:hypothetical protein [Bacilli bacterium]